MREQTDPLRQPTPDAVRASPTAPSLRGILAVCAAAGVFLGLIGPLQTTPAPLAMRLGYWTVATVSGGLLGWATTRVVMRWSYLHGRPWLAILAIAAAMTPPMTLLIWVWGRLAYAGFEEFGSFGHLIGPTALMCLTLTTVSHLALAGLPRHEPAVAEPAGIAVRFLDRIPPRLRGAPLYAVEAEDHYLRVHTAAGSDLILLRLTDALSELAALDGARTHRSWWVARAAVRDVSRHDGRATLTLENGLEVPVSRAHAAALRQAGWF